MTPVHGPRDVLSPMRHESKRALTLENKVDQAAGHFFIPQAPGQMPESRSVEKIKSDIKKTKEFIASGGKIETFSEQIAKKALEISIKSRDQIATSQVPKEEEKLYHQVVVKQAPLVHSKQRVVSRVLPVPQQLEVQAKSDPKSQPYSKQKEVKQFEAAIEKEIFEKTSKHRRKVIETEVRQGKDERINNKNEQDRNEQDRQDRLKPAG
ncbi:MAG: hypothetical protein JSR37_07185 [Verrucomicrobia bacterium]|nr:hypothetical protein [Verrucomicrobiota bacterium]MBS0637088.1 hypothetical protein [Verrucomicrobiota bacterium]